MKSDGTSHLLELLLTLLSASLLSLGSTLPADLYEALSAVGYKWLFLLLLTLLLALLILSLSYYKNIYKNRFLLKQWEKTKANYILQEIATGVKVFIPRKLEDRVCDTHWLCPNCFNVDHLESIYQLETRGDNVTYYIYVCHNCKNKISIENKNYTDPFSGIDLNQKIY